MRIAKLKDLLSDVEIKNIERKPNIDTSKLLDKLVSELTWLDLAYTWLCLDHKSKFLPAGSFVANCADELHKRIIDKGFLIY